MEANELIEFIELQMYILKKEAADKQRVSEHDVITHMIGRFKRIEKEIAEYRNN